MRPCRCPLRPRRAHDTLSTYRCRWRGSDTPCMTSAHPRGRQPGGSTPATPCITPPNQTWHAHTRLGGAKPYLVPALRSHERRLSREWPLFWPGSAPVPAHTPQNTPSAPPSPRHRPRLGKATCKHTKPPCQTPPRAAKQARPSPSMSPGRGAAARTAKPTSSHLPATLRTQPGAGRARAPLHRIHHLKGGVQRRRSGSVRRPRRSLHIFQALCCPGEGPAPSGAQRRLPPGGTLKRPLAALPNRKAPPYPRERRPGRVAHRRSGSRRAGHARGQRDAGGPHAGGKPWAGPSGIPLAIPIGVPRGGRLAVER